MTTMLAGVGVSRSVPPNETAISRTAIRASIESTSTGPPTLDSAKTPSGPVQRTTALLVSSTVAVTPERERPSHDRADQATPTTKLISDFDVSRQIDPTKLCGGKPVLREVWRNEISVHEGAGGVAYLSVRA